MKLKSIIALSLTGLIAFGGIIGFSASVTRIKPGYVGIVYSVNGGVRDGILTQGVRFVTPFIHKVNSYSVATEQAYLSRDKKEGSKDDDSFNIVTSDGKTVNVDLEFSYHFDADVLPKTFTRFKGQDGKTIEDTFIRGKIKAWANEASSKFAVIDIYGEKRAELNTAVFDHVRSKFEEYGIVIDSVNFSRIELDQATAAAIQERVNKQQQLETEKLEAERTKIEAEKKLIQAEADKKAKIIQAEADAEAELLKARAEAEANELKSKSLTEAILKEMEMQARIAHGWKTIESGSVITDVRN